MTMRSEHYYLHPYLLRDTITWQLANSKRLETKIRERLENDRLKNKRQHHKEISK